MLSQSYAVSVTVGQNYNGADLIQIPYTDNENCYDEWIFESAEMDAFLLVISDNSGGHDHSSFVTTTIPDIHSLGNETIDSLITSRTDVDIVKEQMESHRIFVYRGHGGSDDNGAYFMLGEGYPWISSTDIYDYENEQPIYNFSDTYLMLFIACQTGDKEERSLPAAAVAAGAEYAIGFKISIGCSYANVWVQKNFEYYLSGWSITQACNRATIDAFPQYSGEPTYVYYLAN